MTKIQNFTDLTAWKESHKLVLLVYKLTDKYPSKEQFILVAQILRAVVSVSSNLAEGFGRQSVKEKIQFYYIAQGSLIETQNQLIISKDLKYVTSEEFNKFWNQSISVKMLISGLIRSLRNI